jgi:hypothetical protein
MAKKVKINIQNVDFDKFEVQKNLRLGNFTWKTQTGDIFHIADMTDSHVINTIHHIDNRITELKPMTKKLPEWTKVLDNLIIEAYQRKLITKEKIPELNNYLIII